jgi:superfamily I DNA/RNA helicase
MVMDPRSASSTRYSQQSTFVNVEEETLQGSAIPLNESQMDAVVNLEPGLDIIHGPPGTGKSTTIWHIINSRLAPKSQCLVTCTRNQAIDAVVNKVASFGVLVFGRDDRLGSQSRQFTLKARVDNASEVLYWESHVQNYMDIKTRLLVGLNAGMWKHWLARFPGLMDLQSRAKVTTTGENGAALWTKAFKRILFKNARQRHFKSFDQFSSLIGSLEKRLQLQASSTRLAKTNEILTTTKVYLCTVDSTLRMVRTLADNEVSLSLDTCIVDEAGCVLETAIPVLMRFQPKNLVLVGDHLQLQPFSVIQADFHCDKHHTRSLLERAISAGLTPKFLSLQYRMHPDLCSLVSRLFYDDQLKSAITLHTSRASKTPCVWFDVEGVEVSHNRRGYSNEEEAIMVIEVARTVSGQRTPGQTIFIVTFYNKQRLRLLDLVEKDAALKKIKDVGHLQVLSIDACQGSEADYVIMSTVRTESVGKFMEDKRRLCVGLSRAKEACFIVGHRRNMHKNGRLLWKTVVDHFTPL